MRLRHESNFKLDDAPNRHRERIRFRLGLKRKLTDSISFGGRMITGNPGDPNSSHRTIGSVFDSFAFSVDRAFLKYQPKWAGESWLIAGKFSHPFYNNPIYGELVWDGDIQPEGFAINVSLPQLGIIEKLNFIAGEYEILEQDPGRELFSSVYQLSAQVTASENLNVNLAVGYYFYSDISASPVFSDNAGNAGVDTDGDSVEDDFVSDFGILNPIIAVSYNAGKYPITFSAELIQNLRAEGDKDSGWAAGFMIGKAKKPGDWSLYYQRQVVKQDAVLSPFSQDDFLFRTNHQSHVFGFKYKSLDNIVFHLWGLASVRDLKSASVIADSDEDQWRARLDVNMKF